MSLFEWDIWNEVLRTNAKSNDLWAYIDPSINGKKFLERLIKLEVLDFPKYIYNNR